MQDFFDLNGHVCITFEKLGLSVFDVLVRRLLNLTEIQANVKRKSRNKTGLFNTKLTKPDTSFTSYA